MSTCIIIEFQILDMIRVRSFLTSVGLCCLFSLYYFIWRDWAESRVCNATIVTAYFKMKSKVRIHFWKTKKFKQNGQNWIRNKVGNPLVAKRCVFLLLWICWENVSSWQKIIYHHPLFCTELNPTTFHLFSLN